MPITVTQTNESASLKLISATEFVSSATTTWLVMGAGSAASAVASGPAVGTDAISVAGVSALCDSSTATAIQDSSGSNKIYEIQATYTSAIELAFNAFSSDVGGTYVDVWRTQTSFGSGDPDNFDIGGTSLDSQGVAVSRFVVQSTVSTSRRYTTVPWSTIWSAIGKRNSVAYNGAGIGQLLMSGIRVNTISAAIYEVSYTYLSDGLYHMRQVATREAGDSRIWLEDGVAKEVKNVQPFPDKIAFGTVIG